VAGSTGGLVGAAAGGGAGGALGNYMGASADRDDRDDRRYRGHDNRGKWKHRDRGRHVGHNKHWRDR
jgi:hypothetical protein